jgi:hypothetical protein
MAENLLKPRVSRLILTTLTTIEIIVVVSLKDTMNLRLFHWDERVTEGKHSCYACEPEDLSRVL